MSCNKVILVILDGWGVAPADRGNAIVQAKPNYYNKLCRDYPFQTLNASSLEVGLPAEVMGNSEVGHMNIGCGRVVEQDQVRINRSIDSGEIFRNPDFQKMLQNSKEHQSDIHLMGLISDGCVHSSEQHYLKLIEFIGSVKHPKSRILFHAISDGRDVAPHSAEPFLTRLEHCLELAGGRIVSLSGRFYAMDRDHRWERTRLAFQAMVHQNSKFSFKSVKEALAQAYQRGESDEFVQPSLVGLDSSAKLKEHDSLLCFNFRADRMRQIYGAILGRHVSEGFEKVSHIFTMSMTQYGPEFDRPVLSQKQNLEMSLGEFLSQNKLNQFRAAETEKYAHVTFFFNGGKENPFEGESRKLIPSPKVKTYDQSPGMNASKLTQEVLAQMDLGMDFIVVNYAQPDMVGHTGNFEASLEAVRVTDECIQSLAEKAKDKGYGFVLTADHGNIEMMIDPNTGDPHTSHTLNPVPIVVIPPQGFSNVNLKSGGALSNIAPTILDLMDLGKPSEMTSPSLLK